MSSITEVANKFFEACDTGKGWEGCKESRMRRFLLKPSRSRI